MHGISENLAVGTGVIGINGSINTGGSANADDRNPVNERLAFDVAKEFVQVCMTQGGETVVGFFKSSLNPTSTDMQGFVIPCENKESAAKLVATFAELFVQAIKRYKVLEG